MIRLSVFAVKFSASNLKHTVDLFLYDDDDVAAAAADGRPNVGSSELVHRIPKSLYRHAVLEELVADDDSFDG